jgi:hypothetical protein
MELVIYSSRTRGFDGQIFVVRTVNSSQKFMSKFFWKLKQALLKELNIN